MYMYRPLQPAFVADFRLDMPEVRRYMIGPRLLRVPCRGGDLRNFREAFPVRVESRDLVLRKTIPSLHEAFISRNLHFGKPPLLEAMLGASCNLTNLRGSLSCGPAGIPAEDAESAAAAP